MRPQPIDCPLSRCAGVWEAELQCDPDKEYILHGIKYGFNLIDTNSIVPSTAVEVENYPSVTTSPNKHLVEAQILEEIAEGNYSEISIKPHIVSAMGAIKKQDGGVRLILDASQLEGRSLNDLASPEVSEFQSLKDALDIIHPYYFCAKVDLKAAYRSCGIREEDRRLAGLKWKFSAAPDFQYLIDNRLPFGARKSAYHFNNITQSVRRMMRRRGYKIVVFMDDFLIAEKDFATCFAAYNTLINLLRSLGFSLNYKKLVDPTQSLVYLGVHIDTCAGFMSLDSDKTASLINLLQETLKRTRLSKKQLQSLAGKLAWASHVTPWGKTHTCALFRQLSMLKKLSHKVKISVFRDDINWWQNCLKRGNHCRRLWDNRPIIYISTDASRPGGRAFRANNGD